MIHLDNRVGSRELAHYIPDSELCRLPFGDVSWLGSGPGDLPWLVGLERKTLSDFLSSMISGRFSGHQLPGLLRSYNTVYVVVEGSWRRSHGGSLQCPRRSGWGTFLLRNRPFAWDTLMGMVFTLQMAAGVIVLQSRDIRETAALITALHEWWSRPWSSHRSHLRPRDPVTATLASPSLVQTIASILPGIGIERCKSVALRFDSVAEMVNANEQEWRSIDGVGNILAHRIMLAIHKDLLTRH